MIVDKQLLNNYNIITIFYHRYINNTILIAVIVLYHILLL